MARQPSMVALFSLVAGAALVGCNSQLVDAVISPCNPGADAAACPDAIWPNGHSIANSDPWLVQHHDDVRLLRPRVLILDFYNGLDLDGIRGVAERQISALAEGSRYHAYSNPDAPPFLQYEIAGIVDFTDHPPPIDWPNASSTRLPVKPDGTFDFAPLFGSDFANAYGFADPAHPGQNLGLCALFEQGIVNEVWLAVTDPPREPPSFVECKQTYDADGHPIAGSFVSTGSGGDEICAAAAGCKVSVRIAHLSGARGPGCDLMVRGWSFEGAHKAIPYLADNSLHFLNYDLQARFGVPFTSFEDICTPNSTCITHPTSNVATGVLSDGTRWRFDPFDQGCGDTAYPANARFTWDFQNGATVQSHCEHYGMRDGPDGNDAPDEYSMDKVSDYDQRYPDCGGGWQMYWRQSIPGLDNHAFAADGRPMKNWWPFLFY